MRSLEKNFHHLQDEYSQSKEYKELVEIKRERARIKESFTKKLDVAFTSGGSSIINHNQQLKVHKTVIFSNNQTS